MPRIAAGMLVLLSLVASAGERSHAQEPDTTPPVFVSASTNGTSVVITFSEDIYVSPLVTYARELYDVPLPRFLKASFNVSINAHDISLNDNTYISGRTLTLDLAFHAGTGDQVKVSYNNIFATNAGGILTDAAGNYVPLFSSQDVQNNSSGDGSNLVLGPKLTPLEITIQEGDTGSYTVALESEPSESVTVKILPYQTVQVNSYELTFTTENWNEPQEVTVTPYGDNDSIDAWAAVLHYTEGVVNGNWTFVRIVVDDQDTPLVVSGKSSVSYAENAATGVATYSVTGKRSIRWSLLGEDKDRLSISAGGVLSFHSPPDFEHPADHDDDNTYRVFIHAASGSSTGFLPVAIAVTNLAEPPKFPSTTTTRELPENSITGVSVGEAVEATDDAGDTVTYTLEGTDADSFDIDSTTGEIRTKSGVSYDHETKSTYSVTVKATDGSAPPQTGTTDVAIAVTDVNDAPAFPTTEDGLRSVKENSIAMTNVGNAVAATDQDSGAALSYTLTGTDATQFEIVEASGQIQTKSGVTYDHETQSSYSVIVNVSDGKDLDGNAEAPPVTDASIAVTITIDDIDEKPELTGPISATYRENDSAPVARYTAQDPEGATITWSLSGAQGTSFSIDNGVVEFNTPPDFETRRTYSVTVEASDSDIAPRLTARRNLVVTVKDENEPPVFTSSVPGTLSHDENRTGTIAGARFAANDPDAGDTVRWSLGGSDGASFTITNGVLAFDSTKPAPDHEAQETYQVTVEAIGGGDTATQSVTVTINDLEEDGSLSLPLQPQVGTSFEATFTEGDDVTSESWQWARSTSRSGGWNDITGARGPRYTPVEADVNHYLRVTIEYDDGHGQKDLEAMSRNRVQAREGDNTPPTFPNTTQTRSVNENARTGANVGNPVTATDIDPGDFLNYEISGSSLFTIHSLGQVRVAPGAILNHESPGGDSHLVTVTATDPSGASASASVTIEVADVNEAPVAEDHDVTTTEDTATSPIAVLFNDSDPDEDDILDTLTVLLHGRPRNGSVRLNTDKTFTYTPTANYADHDSFTYQIRDDGNLLSNVATVAVTIDPVNDPPTFPAGPLMRTVDWSAVAGASVGAPVTATDVDQEPLEYSLSGGSGAFEVDRHTGQIKVTGNAPLDTENPYTVTVTADDQNGGVVGVEVTIAVTARPVTRPVTFTGGGGGGGPSGPTPSTTDFEWTVKRDIETLDAGNNTPTGMWSDGTTLWLVDNPDGAGDAAYAYDAATGERLEDREFVLDERNRAPRGIWSDGKGIVWVSDSGRDTLFAYDLASGERLEDRDIDLADGNRDPRGIWSDGTTIWVLDRNPSLFAYDLATGDLLGKYALDSRNGDPYGIWSDGVTVWVSDHGEKDLLAYHLSTRQEAEAAGDDANLERVRDEDFTNLSRASNNSPRGIWSDGDVMYVVDESDDKVYTYNMPDAINARLAALTLEGIDFGEFDRNRTNYAGVAAEGVTETVVTAEAMQRRTGVVIDPPDADGNEANGYQVALEGLAEITVTVTSADGSRMKTYRVTFAQEVRGIALDAGWNTFAWPGPDGVAIADALRGDGDLANDISATVAALYGWDDEANAWLAYFPALGDVPGVNTLATLDHGAAYWIAVTEPVTWTGPDFATVADVEVEATARATAFAGTVTDPDGQALAGLAVEVYVGDTRCNAGEPVATYRASEDGGEVTRYYASVAHADQLAGCATAGADVTFRVGDRAALETGAWDNSAYPWQTLDLTLAQETATEETVTIDVTVWRRNEEPFNALADLFISTRAPGEGWDTHDDDGPLAMTLYTSPSTGAQNWYRSDLTPVEVVLADGSTVTIDVAVWRNVSSPTSLYISTRLPGEGWITHDDDGPLTVTLYTNPSSGAQNWYRSDLTPIEVALQ